MKETSQRHLSEPAVRRWTFGRRLQPLPPVVPPSIVLLTLFFTKLLRRFLSGPLGPMPLLWLCFLPKSLLPPLLPLQPLKFLCASTILQFCLRLLHGRSHFSLRKEKTLFRDFRVKWKSPPPPLPPSCCLLLPSFPSVHTHASSLDSNFTVIYGNPSSKPFSQRQIPPLSVPPPMLRSSSTACLISPPLD